MQPVTESLPPDDAEDAENEDDMKHPAYHLRINKAVDRLLFADVLRKIGPDYSECKYYSLAGPFLEDLRVMEHFFPDMRLISFESNMQTYKRQDFHLFNSNIELLNTTAADYLTHEYQPGVQDIFWLDYTDLSYLHFEEFQRVLVAVPLGSIVKITLRAAPDMDLDPIKDYVPAELLTDIQSKIEADFESKFRDVLMRPIPGPFAGMKEYAKMVQMMLKRAASNAVDTTGSDRDFLPLQSARYSDQTQMLSVTGIVYERGMEDKIRTQFSSVRWIDFDWAEPKEINIPALSAKERLWLERYLPVETSQDAGDILHGRLEYNIDNGAKRSRQQLSQYADHYREYPNFVRIFS